MLAPVRRDQAVITVEIQEDNVFCVLDDHEGQTARIVARDSAWNAKAFRINRFSHVVLKCRFAGRRQRKLESGQIFADISRWLGRARALPEPAEIGMTIRQTRRWLQRAFRFLGGQALTANNSGYKREQKHLLTNHTNYDRVYGE